MNAVITRRAVSLCLAKNLPTDYCTADPITPKSTNYFGTVPTIEGFKQVSLVCRPRRQDQSVFLLSVGNFNCSFQQIGRHINADRLGL